MTGLRFDFLWKDCNRIQKMARRLRLTQHFNKWIELKRRLIGLFFMNSLEVSLEIKDDKTEVAIGRNNQYLQDFARR